MAWGRIAGMTTDPYPTCPYCGTLDDWQTMHCDRQDCGHCGAVRHRFDGDSPWQYVAPATLRAARRAAALIRDVFDESASE